jgi:hypothetical protein
VHASSEEKSGNSNAIFCEELDQVFDNFSTYHMKILSWDFNANVGRENIFKSTIGNESLQQDSNDNGVRIANYATYEHLIVKSTMFPHRNIHKYTWTSHDWKTHNMIVQIFTGRRWYSSILDVRSTRGLTVILITVWWLQMLGID